MSDYTPSRATAARLVRLAGDCLARQGDGRLCILNYHRVLEAGDPLLESEPDVATFRWQMKLLADRFNVMPLDAALEALAAHRIPARAVAITFDDGYRSTHDLALPVLKEFGLPATVFVTTGCMSEGNMWNDRILEAVRRLPEGSLDLTNWKGGVYEIHTLQDRKAAIHRLTESAKYLPPQERVELTRELEQRVGGAPASGLMLTPEMVRALAGANVEIGGHTVSHPILTSLDDAAARAEISDCKRQLEAITGAPVRFFAYPNGKQGIDFDQRHAAMARDAGYAAAFTTAVGAASAANDRYRLPRSRPWDASPFFFTLRLLRWLAA
jgi:peptidoglycan/xylan/chitin deacetylase (PgdA/CDA1 family)